MTDLEDARQNAIRVYICDKRTNNSNDRSKIPLDEHSYLITV